MNATARVVHPHQVLPNSDYHEWVVIVGPNPHQSGGADWIPLECNNPECNGEGIVAKVAVAALLEPVTS